MASPRQPLSAQSLPAQSLPAQSPAGQPLPAQSAQSLSAQPPVRWGVIGTANIAARAFLPALRSAGGRAVAVGSRSAARATEWAARHGVERGASYADIVDAEDIDAVYVALPNEQHARWAAAACAAGKAVLCEKPLTLDGPGAAALVADTGPDALLWEAFVFPFHPQTALLRELIADGRIGAPREIAAEFHFQLTRPDNIRLRPEHGGGALYDVGCYPVRLARLLFESEPVRAAAAMSPGPTGVDLDVSAVVDFPDERRLLLSAGLRRAPSTFARIIGTDAELRVSNPFHPTASDTVELWERGARAQTWAPGEGTAFHHAIEHIQQVLRDRLRPRDQVRPEDQARPQNQVGPRDQVRPRYRAADDAVAQARALDLVRAAGMTPIATEGRQ